MTSPEESINQNFDPKKNALGVRIQARHHVLFFQQTGGALLTTLKGQRKHFLTYCSSR